MGNIFTHEGEKGKLIDIFYRQLMNRTVVSSETVLAEADGGTLSVGNVSSHPMRNTLKKAVQEVIDLLCEHGYPVLVTKEKRNTF